MAIKTIEHAIIERAWAEGWIRPQIPPQRTGRVVAVVGSGPAGLACAQQLARAGHRVTVYEKNAKIGGLLRYGIPDFKMEKSVIDRRMSQMQAEGVEFRVNNNIGVDIPVERLADEYDALVLAGGCEQPRDLPVPGRELGGVHFAMPFLTQQNRRVGGEPVMGVKPISAEGRARDRDRRWGHGVGLRGDGEPPGCGVGDAVGAAAAPAGGVGQAVGVAELADSAADLVEPPRGLRAAMVGGDQVVHRQRRRGAEPPRR